MATQNVVLNGNLGPEFDIGTIEANKITLKTDLSLVKAADGTYSVDITALSLVSSDTGNVLSVGADGGVFFNQAALQAIETAWQGDDPSGFLTVTEGGTNGHDVTYGFDFTNADFIEGVQDAVGQAVLAGAGIEYDDVADSISSALGNLTFGDGLTATGLTSVAVLADPASPSPVTVSATGISVTPGISTDANNIAKLGTDNKVLVDPADIKALMTEEICDAFGNPLFRACPA